MGIPGFTKYINDRADLYFDKHELRDCTLIIDGHSISCQLYNWKHWQFDGRSNNCLGGDYDKYAYIVENFFGMLKEVRVKPIVIFDGGFEQRKLPTILSRMKDKIKIADKLTPNFEATNQQQVVFPLFLRETFKDMLRNLDITMLMCEYEADTEIASIAKALNCPVLTFDSDYFLFGAQYIPFRSLDGKVTAIENWRTGTYKCIMCKLYRMDKFLQSFAGLDENTLHLLPVLLGNDYIDVFVFQRFLDFINAGNVNAQHRIEVILNWLRTLNPEAAILEILRKFQSVSKRLHLLNKIEKIVTSYYFVESKLFKYLNIPKYNPKYKQIDFHKLRKILEKQSDGISAEDSLQQTEPSQESSSELCATEIQPEKDTSDEANANTTQLSESTEQNPVKDQEKEVVDKTGNKESPKNGMDDKCENGEIDCDTRSNTQECEAIESDSEVPSQHLVKFEETHLEKENISANPISKLFQKNYTKCEYPSSFMDILTQNTYYCIPQVEDHSEKNSHFPSFEILQAIHRILCGSTSKDFTIVGRSEGTNVEWFPQEKYTVQVPSLEDIEQLTLQGRREAFLKILNIEDSFVSLLEHFPIEWHTFLISLKFASTKIKFETPLIYSLILSFIVLNYIDQRIGYYRSEKRYKNKYYNFMQNLPPSNEHIPFRADRNCFYYFPNKDCIVFLQKVIHLFSINQSQNSACFDKHVLHQMAQIQSVLLHIKYLNALMKYPYPNLVIHQIFDGTFIYNLTKTFKEKPAELENNYLNVFFKDCPSISAALKYVLNMLNKQILL